VLIYTKQVIRESNTKTASPVSETSYFEPGYPLFLENRTWVMNPAGHYSNLDHRIILYNVLIDSFPVSGVIPTCQQSGLSGNRTGWKIRASPSVEGPRDAVSEKNRCRKTTKRQRQDHRSASCLFHAQSATRYG